MKRCLVMSVFVGLVVLVAAPVLADDIFPPPWDRSGPDSTYQRWEFPTPDPMPFPDDAMNPWGVEPATVTPGPGMDWIEVDPEGSGRIGIWPLSGEIEVPVFNTPPDPLREKVMWVQVTWRPQPGTTGTPTVTAEADHPDPGQGGMGDIAYDPVVGDLPDAFGWINSAYELSLPFNPDMETITVSGDIDVDELVIDTICRVPEPGSIVMVLSAGLVGLIVLIRRRK